MHTKCVILDRELVYDGSVNLTHNGMENNKEHLYRITHAATVARVFDDFRREWARAEVVGADKIQIMVQKNLEAKEKKASSKGSANSKPKPPLNRDLTDDFTTVDGADE